MKKLAVIASGWHYSSHFYEKIAKQQKAEGWDIELFVISHRHPEHKDTIKEKEHVRNYEGKELMTYLDKVMYETPITEKEITDLGWTYIEKPNTIGDMEVFNQWSDDYNYLDYDLFLITHDDNFILSDKIFNQNRTFQVFFIFGAENGRFVGEEDISWDECDCMYKMVCCLIFNTICDYMEMQ